MSDIENVRFKMRRDKKDTWAARNPILRDGEPGYEKDTRLMKIGDGLTAWNDLPYTCADGGGGDGSLLQHINSPLPHPVYDDGPSLALLYENAKAG